MDQIQISPWLIMWGLIIIVVLALTGQLQRFRPKKKEITTEREIESAMQPVYIDKVFGVTGKIVGEIDDGVEVIGGVVNHRMILKVQGQDAKLHEIPVNSAQLWRNREAQLGQPGGLIIREATAQQTPMVLIEKEDLVKQIQQQKERIESQQTRIDELTKSHEEYMRAFTEQAKEARRNLGAIEPKPGNTGLAEGQ